jgi:RimJ/RimL family protein N-acetyltransferase
VPQSPGWGDAWVGTKDYAAWLLRWPRSRHIGISCCHDRQSNSKTRSFARDGTPAAQTLADREAVVLHELWTERDPRVPPHRRIDADGHPTIADLENWIRTNQPSSIGLLAVERKAAGDVIGYCGLIDSGRASDDEPELAFELLRRVWRQGYATEAS